MISILERWGEYHGEYVVIIDEYRAASPRDLEAFLDKIASRAANTNERMQLNRLSRLITLVITTSDAIATRAWDNARWKVGWVLIWNLSREASKRLSEQLGIKGDEDPLWRLVGENPRALEEIRRRGLAKRLGKGLEWVLDWMVRVSRDIDGLFGEPMRRHLL